MHSERYVPWVAARLLLTAAAIWAVVAIYTTRLNPEIRFLSNTANLQANYARKLAQSHENKLIVVGGSSAMFSIIGEQLLDDYNLPTVNMGLNAGLGAHVMAERAVASLNRGDTLVFAVEPGLLTGSIMHPILGIGFSYALGHSEWVRNPVLTGVRTPLMSACLALRPGGYHVVLFLYKLVTNRPHYSYDVADASPSGWSHTNRRKPLIDEPVVRTPISDDARRFLDSLRRWCDKHQVRVVYSLPWRWVSKANIETHRKANAKLLSEIAEYLPILRDPSLGAIPEQDYFSDTIWHLNKEGSRLRTHELGQQIVNWQIWTHNELHRLSTNTSPLRQTWFDNLP